jgi:hypothetical protein
MPFTATVLAPTEDSDKFPLRADAFRNTGTAIVTRKIVTAACAAFVTRRVSPGGILRVQDIYLPFLLCSLLNLAAHRYLRIHQSGKQESTLSTSVKLFTEDT